MPERLAQACRALGCPHVGRGGVEGGAVGEGGWGGRGGSGGARGYDREWQAFTGRYFGELYDLKVPRAGLCGCRHPSAPVTLDSECAATGRAQLATLIDHIRPIRGRHDPRLYDVSNLQGLCDRCHNRKRQREQQQKRRRA